MFSLLTSQTRPAVVAAVAGSAELASARERGISTTDTRSLAGLDSALVSLITTAGRGSLLLWFKNITPFAAGMRAHRVPLWASSTEALRSALLTSLVSLDNGREDTTASEDNSSSSLAADDEDDDEADDGEDDGDDVAEYDEVERRLRE